MDIRFLPALLLALLSPSLAPAAGLPHHEAVAPGVHAAGFADRWRSANCGWVVLRDQVLLVDLPRGIAAADFLAEVARSSDKPPRRLVLTLFQDGDAALVEALLARGVARVQTSPAIRDALVASPSKVAPEAVEALSEKTAIGDAAVPAAFVPLDGVVGKGGGVVHLPGARVLFAGPFVVHGPRAPLPGTDTAAWLAALEQLERLKPAHVVPGFGSWGGPERLTRQRRWLAELRRQVGYLIACGRPSAVVRDEVRIPADYLAWMPYDTATAEDLAHVWRELTVPAAPFGNRPPAKDDSRPHALVLIGDEPHEPGHIEEGLRPAFAAAGVVPHFTVDVRALSAENLGRVQLLVILRDGLQRPRTGAKSNYVWMTPEQEKAVVNFVEGGGGFLNLHNALGLYPPDGPYLKLAGGRYTGHGPLERFRVEVADAGHPVTRGVAAFTVADEQHAPEYDRDRVRLLLRARSDEGKVTAAGWVREPGRGRFCHLAPGHTREALLHPTYQRLMRNAMLWCLGKEVPEVKRP
jgi:type 1 glutamine amidotransferase